MGKIIRTKSTANNKGKSSLKIAGFSVLVLLILTGFYGFYKFAGREGDNYEERYAEYKNERNEFNKNRKLSKENIEYRKTVILVDNFHYTDRDGLPVFHTYFQTNKYLDINEIDKELYELKNKINSDSLDVNSLFVKAFFFTTDKEKPYRIVLVKYDNLHLKADYKQVTKLRSTNSFSIKSEYEKPYILSIQIDENYKSGVIQAYAYELKIDPKENSVEVYNFNPMPELIGSYKFDEFREMNYPGISENIDLADIHTAYRIYNKLANLKMSYRSPVTRSTESYQNGLEVQNVMYNWELTLDDDTAFIRIRSDDVKGYYLVNKLDGNLFQVKTSFVNNSGISTDYLIQHLSIEQ
jgi:hypothetical protein